MLFDSLKDKTNIRIYSVDSNCVELIKIAKMLNKTPTKRAFPCLPALFNTILILGVCGTLICSCKKGEDDPILTLNSRKARMVGEWRFTKGELVIGTTDVSTFTRYNEVFVFNSSSYELTSSGQSTAVKSKGSFILSLKITKEGGFTVEEIFDGKILQASGTWDFNSGVSNKKAKSEVNFNLSTLTSGVTGGYHLWNQSSTSFTYKIRELRSERLVLEIDRLIFEESSGPKQSFKGTFEFVQ